MEIKSVILPTSAALIAYEWRYLFPQYLSINSLMLVLVAAVMTLVILALCFNIYTAMNDMEKQVNKITFVKTRKPIIKSAHAAIVILLVLLGCNTVNSDNAMIASLLFSLSVLMIGFLASILFDMLAIFFAIKPFKGD